MLPLALEISRRWHAGCSPTSEAAVRGGRDGGEGWSCTPRRPPPTSPRSSRPARRSGCRSRRPRACTTRCRAPTAPGRACTASCRCSPRPRWPAAGRRCPTWPGCSPTRTRTRSRSPRPDCPVGTRSSARPSGLTAIGSCSVAEPVADRTAPGVLDRCPIGRRRCLDDRLLLPGPAPEVAPDVAANRYMKSARRHTRALRPGSRRSPSSARPARSACAAPSPSAPAAARRSPAAACARGPRAPSGTSPAPPPRCGA